MATVAGLLERSGAKPERASQRISAVLATPDPARALEVRVGSPLIELVRVAFDRHGRGVEHLHALYRPDRYHFELDLVREPDGRTWSPDVLGQGGRRRKTLRAVEKEGSDEA